jgi:DnaK suppressor protein
MAQSKRKPAAAARKPAAKKKAAAKPKAPPRKAPARKPQKPAATKGKARRGATATRPAKPVKRVAAPKKAPARTAKPTGKPVKTPPVAAAKPKATSVAAGKVAAAVAKKDKDTITREDGRYALPSTVVVTLPPNYRPSPREEYMNPRQLAYFRAKLLRWREDLVEESKQTIDNLREEVRDVGDEAERATRETENSLELRTRDRYRKLIAKIDKALKRIEEGRYGYCEETDEEIGLERLEARPIATLCLDAQERWEHRQKQMGD